MVKAGSVTVDIVVVDGGMAVLLVEADVDGIRTEGEIQRGAQDSAELFDLLGSHFREFDSRSHWLATGCLLLRRIRVSGGLVGPSASTSLVLMVARVIVFEAASVCALSVAKIGPTLAGRVS